MRQSLNIMTQAIKFLKYFNDIDSYNYCINNNKLTPPNRGLMKNFMESLINHFKLYTEGISINQEEVYNVVEAPKVNLEYIC
jgi:NADH-quinone oxidoreductase subunit D